MLCNVDRHILIDDMSMRDTIPRPSTCTRSGAKGNHRLFLLLPISVDGPKKVSRIKRIPEASSFGQGGTEGWHLVVVAVKCPFTVSGEYVEMRQLQFSWVNE